nr:immunoglobulin heavy chain junction region [Mus musculus]MBK4186577.1 immunoglobulin heavy chain junction region [Mus musculus]
CARTYYSFYAMDYW